MINQLKKRINDLRQDIKHTEEQLSQLNRDIPSQRSHARKLGAYKNATLKTLYTNQQLLQLIPGGNREDRR